MKSIRLISRFILGFVFILSGFVKAIDPLGSSYKFTDYFYVFQLGFLDSLSLSLGIFLAAFELVLGIVLILGYQKKITYWTLFLFMGFFTILTFFLAIYNPVTDCGCFGDAIILTNWQTFLKNIILMIFVFLLFYGRRRVKNVLKSRHEKGLIVFFFIASILLSLHCIRHLPLIDFRAYDVGTSIQEGMEIPQDAPMDEFSTTLIYRNLETGDTDEFTLANYPKDTLKWEFVNSESKLISKGYEPPIHDFGLFDKDGFEITDELLTDPGYNLMMVSYDLENADQEALALMNDWYKLQNISGDFTFIPVTSSGTATQMEISQELGLDFSFYIADEIMLKTVVRSNPGFVLLKNGIIIAKWAHRDFPKIEEWESSWIDLIDQFEAEQDPEILMLIEEGYMDVIQWDIIDFDKSALQIVAEKNSKSLAMKNWMIFYISIILLLILLQLPRVASSKRHR